MFRLNIFKLFAKNKSTKVKRHDIPALFINEKLTDIEIKTIYSLKDKLNMLIKPKNINVKNGFLIRNAKGFNSFGIFYKLDIIFCTKNFEMIKTIENFRPQHVSEYFKNAHFIYCLAPGMIRFYNINNKTVLTVF